MSFIALNSLTEQEITAFTQGDCAYLASEIVDMNSDFNMVLITDMEDDDLENSSYHVVAEYKDTGILLDAEGIWNYDSLMDKYDALCDTEMYAVEFSLDLYFDQGGAGRAYSESTVDAATKLLKAFEQHK